MSYEEERKPRFDGSQCMSCGSDDLQDINDETHCMRCGAIHTGPSTVEYGRDVEDRIEDYDRDERNRR